MHAPRTATATSYGVENPRNQRPGSSRGNDVAADRLQEAIVAVYGAVVDPRRWSAALGTLASVASAKGATLCSTKNVDRVITSASLDHSNRQYIRDEWWHRNPRIGGGKRIGPACFVRDTDYLSSGDLAGAFYSDFLQAAGLKHCARTLLNTGYGGDGYVLSIERSHEASPYEPSDLHGLNSVRPALSAAMKLAELTSFRDAESTMRGWDQVGGAGALLGADGRTILTSRAFDALVPAGLRTQWRTLRTDRYEDNLALAERIAAAVRRPLDIEAMNRTPLVLRKRDGSPSLLVDVLPVMGDATHVFGGAFAVALVTDLAVEIGVPEALLRSTFDLTASEARLVRRLTAGSSVADAARDLGLSRETIRTQLKASFAKCGVSRQQDLVLLASRLARRSGGALPSDASPASA